MAYYFRRSILPSRHVTRQARNSNPVLFQSSLSRFYTNSTFPSPPPNIPSGEFTTAFVLDQYLSGVGSRVDKFMGKVETFILVSLISSTILVSGDLLLAWCLNSYNKHKLNKTVEKGTRPDVVGITDADELVPRPLITKRLKEILVPLRNQQSYYVVCGEHGTGKTTLMRIASREVGEDKKRGVQGGRGVIYVDIPPDISDVKDFGEQFGKALNFTFEEKISFTEQLMRKIFGSTDYKDEDPKWKRALKAFKSASAVYKKNNLCHQPPVIVYDNISRLIDINPKILDFLQEDAKDNANDRSYITVFVCSEGSVPKRMESHSSWSRAMPVIEIGDLNEEESIKYLLKRGIKKEEAKRFYGLVGGRILDLKNAADEFLVRQLTFEVIKQGVFGKVFKNLESAEMNPGQANYEAARIIMKVLLYSNNVLHYEMLREMTNMEPNNLLKSNIFAYHPENMTVTFQSRSVECYIRENAYKFVKKRFLFF